MARPTLEFMMSHPAHFIAMGLGSGLGRIAPGTVGTLWAWLSFLLLQHWFTPQQIGLLIAGSIPWAGGPARSRHATCAWPIPETWSGTRSWPSG
ncbi:phosphatidylglycerophosphatase A [Delftia tsuruhatensis]|nr:phosphatidylglycerophosphatase A [Delftia tsuruhatensis]